jgi:hypothetical protein
MQRFIAELSSAIEKADFDSSWQSEASARADLKVDFAFHGRRVSAKIHSENDNGSRRAFAGRSAAWFAGSMQTVMSDGFKAEHSRNPTGSE